MKITGSDIAMSSQRSYVESYSSSESLKMWGNGLQTTIQADNSVIKIEISREGKELQEISSNLVDKTELGENEGISLSEKDKQKIALLEAFFSAVLHKKIKIRIMDKLDIDQRSLNLEINNQRQNIGAQREGWGLIFNSHRLYSEAESVSFDARGVVKTADGKEIKIDINLNMSRTFMSEQNISLRAGDALKMDPLVINYGGTAAQLTDRKFSFDIDSDGKTDQISFAGPGAGFLTLDKNNDGIVNNGSELFGPQLGNGFAELADYDEDKNGWIDENDSVFSKLRIWSKDENGNDCLFALGQQGVGAIYLGNVSTSFAIKDMENQEKGQVQKTGIFLRENGTAGTVQHIDLTI